MTTPSFSAKAGPDGPDGPDGPVGLIGLGNAGTALARPLAQAYQVVGYDLRDEQRAGAEAVGVHWATSVEAVATQCEIVLLNLPTTEASRAVVQALLQVAKPPRIVVETSTVTHALARELADQCKAAGIAFVDAAIAGGVAGMAAGNTTFLVGGSEVDVETVHPVLSAMASSIRHMGPVGAGMGAKVVINAVYHALMVVLLEAASMTEKLDISVPALIDILSSDEGMMRPLQHRLGERILGDNLVAGMSVTNARKDSILAIETAQELGVPLFAIAASHAPYEIAEARGMGQMDYAALAELWRDWCQVRLRES